MIKVRFKYLLERHINDLLSDEELDEFFDLLEVVDSLDQESILREILSERDTNEFLLLKEQKSQLYKKLRFEINSANRFRSRYINSNIRKYASIAAMLLVSLSLFFLLLIINRDNAFDEFYKQSITNNNQDDIYLDTLNVAHVKLPNGEVKIVDESSENDLSNLGIIIDRRLNGDPIYKVQQSKLSNGHNQLFVFSTSKGQSKKIELSDGTLVWLNTNSSLEYPLEFSSKNRKVKIIGEAYFDVQPDSKRPFYVETFSGETVKVLGTEFNIQAYMGDSQIVATLVEGVVQFNSKQQTVLLKPNEQVVMNLNNSSLLKNRVDVSEYIGWKEGVFNFNNLSISQILDKVKRWYDIEDIKYTSISNEKISGTFKRTKSLKSLLNKLEKISNSRFQINNRSILVY